MNNTINLQSLCETRWSSRANTFVVAITAVEYLEEVGDGEDTTYFIHQNVLLNHNSSDR